MKSPGYIGYDPHFARSMVSPEPQPDPAWASYVLEDGCLWRRDYWHTLCVRENVSWLGDDVRNEGHARWLFRDLGVNAGCCSHSHSELVRSL